MIEMFRKKLSRAFTIGIIGIIAVTFAVMGLGSFFSQMMDGGTAAVIDGQKISWQSVNTMYERIRKNLGEEANEKVVKEQLRFMMVQRLALLNKAKALGFRLSDAQLAEALVQMPAFQKEGKFNKEQYLRVLENAAYSDKEFRQELGQDLLIQQLEKGLSESSFSLEPELSRLANLINQKRDFGYFMISLADFRSGIKLQPDAANAYYEKNKTNFISPEQTSLEYVTLGLDKIADQIEVDPEFLKHYYEQHKTAYTVPESFHVRHILISVPQGLQSLEQEKQAKQKAEHLFTELKKGADFIKLAANHSMDESTAKSGGDLGWFVRGQMVPEFENAVMGLKKSKEFSEPIRTQFGYHLIQLLDRKTSQVRTFDDVKTLVKEQYQKEEGQKIFSDRLEQLAKLSFEHSDSLKPLAENLELKIEATPLFSRIEGQDEFTRHPEVIKAAFGEAVLQHKHNSEPIKIKEGVMVVIRQKDHKPSAQKTFAEVEKQIQDILIKEKAQESAKALANTLVEKLKNHENPETLATQHRLKWIVKKQIPRNANNIDQHVLSAVFRAAKPSEKSPVVSLLVHPSGDCVVFNVQKVHEGEYETLDLGLRATYKKGLTDLWTQLEFALYTNMIYSQAKAEFPKAKAP